MTDAADSITGTGHAPGRGGLVIDPPRPREPALGEAAFGEGAPFGGEAPFDEAEVPLYYSRKTADILHKYGPGPRVHFHLGMFESTPNTTVAQHLIRRRITDSQEAVIRHAAATWGAADHPPAALLDIGCGLGGGSIYWAQEHGSTVTGLTITADHIPVMDHLVRRAGVRDRVTPLLGDAHAFREERAYDAAVAVESAVHMDRRRLFAVAARALRPGGWFGLQDHFLCRPEVAGFVNGYYRTRLGTLDEYVRAAREAGFTLERDEDITDPVSEFWVQSMAWTAAELDRTAGAAEPSPIARERLMDSAVGHGRLFRIWRDHAVETRLLLFRLRTD
ncbi:methyltransferase domain-containing protein [Streptomyces sp. S07_1.15]|uniref:SAM-dependent methyltransferase n=1 Tax=Streptomyces sp. S07_1.15 TaxID=2873925 RepID=UPI001D156047|nr:methyltransferase domain-containing protein [Streptomyces sp. S07_1.15]MCC3650477.1 methyltransferase domain-containing protein [Streptomyces sp. S07_1.15]